MICKQQLMKMKEDLLAEEKLIAIQEQLLGFINEQVLKNTGEHYYDGHEIHNEPISEDSA